MPQENDYENIGILGGTFNPIHRGHINLGLTVIRQFPISTVEYILSAYPPHKSGPQIIRPEMRFGMLTNALEPHPQLRPNRYEMDRQQPSWTLVTIKAFMDAHPEKCYFFICGSEAFLAIRTWYQYQTLLDTIGFLVYPRDNNHLSALSALCQEERITIHPEPPTLPKARELTLFSAPAETLSISSTDIRERVLQNQAYEHMLPEPIARIIKEKNLYV